MLTTLQPGAPERDRFIFALFRVGKLLDHSGSGTIVSSDGTLEVRVPDQAAPLLKFWNYHANNRGGPAWRTGLFRYLSEKQTTTVLSEAMGILGDCNDRDLIYEALGRDVLPRYSVAAGATGVPCAEGIAHRLLKERVAADPTLIGLPKSAKARIEYSFLSGDRVDIRFDLANGSAAVVEIETIIVLPGAHQCVKYRALLEAERGDALNSGNVQAVLVAYGFDPTTKDFANRYDIRLVELPP